MSRSIVADRGSSPAPEWGAAAVDAVERAAVPPWEDVHLPAGVYRWGLASCAALGAMLRAAHLTRPFNRLMAWNEGHYAMTALNFDRYGLWAQRNELGVDRTFSPGVPWMIWASFKMFGPSEWAARLPIVICGVLAVVLLGVLVRQLLRSEQIGLIAAACVAVAPGLVYFSQNVQLDTPSICAALAGAVCMVRYRETRRTGALLGAAVFLMLAIWFKFTAALLYPVFLWWWWPVRPARLSRAAAGAAAFIGLTALPSVAWIATRWFARDASGEFFHRDWTLRGLVKALSEIPLSVEAHLFVPLFLLLLGGLAIAGRWRSRLGWIWLWSAPFLVTYVVAPWDSLTNRYYDLPATYVLVTLAALAVWRTRLPRPRGRSWPPRPVALALAAVLAVTVAYDLWDPTGDRLARAAMTHAPAIDPVPFYSARLVAALPPGRTIVDTPQTMFYAGGDPRWIDYTGGDVRWKIDGEWYDYIVLNDYGHGQEPYYVIDNALRAELARHGYVQIGPALWAHVRTRIADLGGYRDPNVPPGAPWEWAGGARP